MSRPKLLNKIFIWTAIAGIVFITHYLRFTTYGLYEDDYWFIAEGLGRSFRWLWDHEIVRAFTLWPQGRPLNHCLPQVVAAFGYKLGGLDALYLLASGWLSLNCILVFSIISKVLSPRAAIVGTFAYLLFPADTTRILLVHAVHLQGSMTFLLIGLLFWLRGRWFKWSSYPIATLSLLSYESAFLPFVLAPLLTFRDRRETLRQWSFHLFSCLTIIAIMALLRLWLSDSRAIEAISNPGQTITRSSVSFFLGPATSAQRLFTAAVEGIERLNLTALWCAIFLVLSFFVLRRTVIAASLVPHHQRSFNTSRILRHLVESTGGAPWWWILPGALLVWGFSYAFTLTNYPPTQLTGRLTSTHLAAAWPASLAIAATMEGIRKMGRIQNGAALVAFSIWLMSVSSYHHYIQRDFQRAFQLQKIFWRGVMELAPEAEVGWTVIVTGTAGPQCQMISSNSWADIYAFRAIVGAAPRDEQTAFAHLGIIGHEVDFRRLESEFVWRPEFWGSEFYPIPKSRLVLLESDHGKLSRVERIQTPAGELQSTTERQRNARDSWPDTPVARRLFPDQYR